MELATKMITKPKIRYKSYLGSWEVTFPDYCTLGNLIYYKTETRSSWKAALTCCRYWYAAKQRRELDALR